MTKIERVIAANRGEIAVRIFQACTELGKETVAIYSEEDMLSPHRYRADEAYLVGRGRTPVGAYLDIDDILRLATEHQVDAIHPGYGFLAENAEFARRCAAAGIVFIGPDPEHLDLFGEKLSARHAAIEAGLRVAAGTAGPVAGVDEALEFAGEHGYPLMVKAVHGGGGRGMRVVQDDRELAAAIDSASREAAAAFGSADVYLEQYIADARHIEVQILGDGQGNVVHLWERDCSVQRRHQKMIEFTPAMSLTDAQRLEICESARRLAEHVGYSNAGTVEFLVDRSGQAYFIEVNPRIQVEHTVTELVTGIDLVQAQIQIAEGASLGDLGINEPPQTRGSAMQCRVTTEDPLNGFLPDNGRILAFRSAGGYGVRLDVGSGITGAEIQPHYDSLLVKVSTWDTDLAKAARRMYRAIREMRVRGVQTNIPFLENLIQHPTFLSGEAATTFLDHHPELFRFPPRQDRGTRLLRYIADRAVNDAHVSNGVGAADRADIRLPEFDPAAADLETAKTVLERDGAEALAAWVSSQQQLLLTDTTMRDAHQSLLATRMRSHDLLRVAPATAALEAPLFSLETWGGATFDVSYRFLKEDPWQRLVGLRRAVPNTLLQMLLRGQSLVGYRAYADNLVQAFVEEAAATGIDVFRIFDSLNYLPNMRGAIEAARKSGKVAEVAICYTGDVLDTSREKYSLDYYLELAREIEDTGAHILAIKDMAGVLTPPAAETLIGALKETVSIPLHLHTHDSAGAGVATVLKAAEAGLDIADGALSSMAGGTSQPSLNAIVAGLRGTERQSDLDLSDLEGLSGYWAEVRERYGMFETGITSPDASVYRHQMPGGQYTNLKAQTEAVGLGRRWPEVVTAYREADRALGEVIKVTPSSKAVGDFALFIVQNDIPFDQLVERLAGLDAPQSVIEMLAGGLGQPPYPFPADLQRAVLRDRKPIDGRPGALLEDVDFAAQENELLETLGRRPARREVISSLIYPEVFLDYQQHADDFGDTSVLDTATFFYGLNPGETAYAQIEQGKILIISITAIGPVQDDGTRVVYFDLNGSPREIETRDLSVAATVARRPRADTGDWRQVAAPMPGTVVQVLPAPGERANRGDQLLVIEAMKMETVITAPRDANVVEVFVRAGESVQPGDLLMRLEDVAVPRPSASDSVTVDYESG